MMTPPTLTPTLSRWYRRPLSVEPPVHALGHMAPKPALIAAAATNKPEAHGPVMAWSQRPIVTGASGGVGYRRTHSDRTFAALTLPDAPDASVDARQGEDSAVILQQAA